MWRIGMCFYCVQSVAYDEPEVRFGAPARRMQRKANGATERIPMNHRAAHPSLSIVIPAYNESARIERTLERVLSCVHDRGWDAEVLVVDDGSTDKTTEIVQQWMVSQPRLRLHQKRGEPRQRVSRSAMVCCRRPVTS